MRCGLFAILFLVALLMSPMPASAEWLTIDQQRLVVGEKLLVHLGHDGIRALELLGDLAPGGPLYNVRG